MPAEARGRIRLIAAAGRRVAQAGKLVELLIFPSRCRLCHALLERPGERIVCRACLAKLKPWRKPACPCCGRFYEAAAEPHLCARCLRSRPAYAVHRSCGPYEGPLRDLILLLKFHGLRVLGKDLARFALATLDKEASLWWGLDAVIPVPLHGRRRRERGFNQAEVIARELAKAKRLPVWTGVLTRMKDTPPQTSLDSEARKSNVRGGFRVSRPGLIKKRTVLLVDDVYTTGSTVGECCRALRRAGAREVRVLTLARS